MGAAFFGFLVGYAVGARRGKEGLREVLDAARELRESEAAADLVAALRDHVRHAAHSLGDRIGGEGGPALEEVLRLARERLHRP